MHLRTASVPFESVPTFQANPSCPLQQCGKTFSEPKQYGVIGYRQTSATAGTVFQDTRKPLKTWFRAMWYVTSQKNGASALGLQRVLGLRSYQTAWAWLHKLRRAMVRPGRDHLSGWVEVDETYIGGWEEGMKGRRRGEKSLIVIAAQAEGNVIGRIRMRVIPDASAASLHPFIEGSVEPGSTVRTDGWQGYAGIDKKGYYGRFRLSEAAHRKPVNYSLVCTAWRHC